MERHWEQEEGPGPAEVGLGRSMQCPEVCCPVLMVWRVGKEEDHSLWCGWSWVAVAACGLDVPIEGEELLWVVLYPGLSDELVTYQPEHTGVGFHFGNLLCHGLRDSCSRESL